MPNYADALSRRAEFTRQETGTYQLRREQWVPRPVDEVFAFFGDAANLQTITPPWLKFRILTPMPIRMARGTAIEYQIGWHFLRLRWKTVIAHWEPPRRFVDVQERGPYRLWHHTHTFVAENGGTLIGDTVHYRLPFGWLGRLVHLLRVRRDLARIFDYRAARIAARFGR